MEFLHEVWGEPTGLVPGGGREAIKAIRDSAKYAEVIIKLL